MFRVEPPAGAEFARWRVQTVEGEAFEAEDLATLRVWIREGRLHPEDTISRSGKHWIPLGDMPEFSDAFAGFPDLPAVLSLTPAAEPYADVSVVGPPPSFAGSELPEPDDAEENTVAGAVSEPSQRLDLTGLLSDPAPEETVVHEEIGDEPLRSSLSGVPRRSMFDEDSASMVLDDLVAPRAADRERTPHAAARRRPKHRTAKVQTVGDAEEIDADRSGVVRVLDVLEEDEDIEALDEAAVEEVDAPDHEPRPDAEDAVSRHSGPRAVVGSGSMLGAVTAHVKPITTPTELPVIEPPKPSAEPESVGATVEPTTGKRASWPLFAGLGLLCGAAVIFGIPQVRAKVMSMAGAVAGHETDVPPEVAAGDAALREGSRQQLVAARKTIDEKMSQGGTLAAAPRTALALVGAELAAAEAVSLRLEAAVSGAGSDAGSRADELAESAMRAFAGLDLQAADPTRVARVRARLRLAQGRPADEILPLIPANEAELHAMVVGAPLWRGEQGRVPSGVISGLNGLPTPSVEAQIVLALAYARGGDEVAAATIRQELRERAPQDPAVIALLGAAAAEPSSVAHDAGTPPSNPDPSNPAPSNPERSSPDEDGGVGDPVVVGEDTPEPGAASAGGAGSKAGGGGGKGMSTDKAIELGCSKVEQGDIGAGLKLLLRAFDRRPNDLDVLVCLGMAHRKKGTTGTALRYYDRALARSPRFLPALLGAARSAAKGKSTERAAGYYRRVLAVSPGHAEAKSYLAKAGAGKGSGASPSPSPASPPGEKPRKTAPPKPPEPSPGAPGN